MFDSASQNKSPIILLVLLSVLVIATLVVASLYFVRPSLEAQYKERASQKQKAAGSLDTKPQVTGKSADLTAVVEAMTKPILPKPVMSKPVMSKQMLLKPMLAKPVKVERSEKDDCGILFYENQLLVRNSEL